jgi:hypothetical protein
MRRPGGLAAALARSISGAVSGPAGETTVGEEVRRLTDHLDLFGYVPMPIALMDARCWSCAP